MPAILFPENQVQPTGPGDGDAGALAAKLPCGDGWLFYELGWTPLDVMLTWLVSGFDRYGATIDPDCAAGAARDRKSVV